MNLHDMLSTDASDNVVLLPTQLTPLQRDLSEALVQMFVPALQQQIQQTLQPSAQQQTAISRLLAGDAQEPLSTHPWAQQIELLYDSLAAVCKHSLLVVDHFLPRKLLLLEVSSRLLRMSGKLTAFNQLVEYAVEQYERAPGSFTRDFTMLVVAESVKELEWVEGVIVGKKLRYTNASGRRLYDDPPVAVSDVADDELPDGRHHRARRRIARAGSPSQVVLHLVTTRQVAAAAAAAGEFDVVFSFDPALDPRAPGLERVRANARGAAWAPVVVPVPVYSVEHIAREMRWADAEWKMAVVKRFVATRFRLFERARSSAAIGNATRASEDPNAPDGTVMEGADTSAAGIAAASAVARWILAWDTNPVPPEALLAPYTAAMALDGIRMDERMREDHLKSLVHLFGDRSAKKVDQDTGIVQTVPTDYHQCKRALALFLHVRIEQVGQLLEVGLGSVLPEFRAAEAARQVEIDADELRVADNFRKLRKLNEGAAVVERKLARAESDHSRVVATEQETRDMLAHLEAVIAEKTEGTEASEKTGDTVDSLVHEQAKVLQDLRTECDRLTEELKKLTDDGEELRAQYQLSSSEAVRATGELSAAQARQAQLEQKLSGPGMAILPSLARKDEQGALETRMLRLAAENHFLSHLFALRLEKIVKERNAVLESTSSGSTSRPSNRISRASTPMI